MQFMESLMCLLLGDFERGQEVDRNDDRKWRGKTLQFRVDLRSHGKKFSSMFNSMPARRRENRNEFPLFRLCVSYKEPVKIICPFVR